jgi:hypothetical protein
MITIILFVVLILFVILILWYYSNREVENFEVSPDYSDSGKANDLLVSIDAKIRQLINYMSNKYLKEESKWADSSDVGISRSGGIGSSNTVVKDIVRRIAENYNPDVIVENDPAHSSETSYTLDKGKKIAFCLRNRKNSQLHDLHTMIFVALHEVSHIGNKAWGHSKNFWETFKFVLHEADVSGIYKSTDYRKAPIVYCGLNVTYNPLYDDSVRKIWE